MRVQPIYLVMISFLVACALQAQITTPQPAALHSDSQVTPVTGESWLIHLHRSFGDTSMGKTGRLGPGPQETTALRPVLQTPMFSAHDAPLRGSDLYRMNCEGCHGKAGLGAPPEINSVINPVRATSVPLVLARMKNAGMEMSYADAAKLAQQSKAALLDRLHKGGENMPAFPQLNEAEIHALLAYLRQLADVPGAAGEQSVVRESHLRVGELIVKSTCHTCHSAVGSDPGPQELMGGAIPPLSSLTRRKREPEFVVKVTQGAPVLMGSPPMLYRGRMPVLFYLSEQEAADVYLYLTLYPPTEQSNAPLMAMHSVQPPSGDGTGSSGPPSRIPNDKVSGKRKVADPSASRMNALPWAAAAFCGLLLLGGLIFTLREFRRLASESPQRNAFSLKYKAGSGLNWSPGGMGKGPFPERPPRSTEIRRDDSQQE